MQKQSIQEKNYLCVIPSIHLRRLLSHSELEVVCDTLVRSSLKLFEAFIETRGMPLPSRNVLPTICCNRRVTSVTRSSRRLLSFVMSVRDGPKFGRCRSLAEEFGRMFGSVRLGNVRLFGRSSAELRQTFGVIGASNWRRFALATGVNQSHYTYY